MFHVFKDVFRMFEMVFIHDGSWDIEMKIYGDIYGDI